MNKKIRNLNISTADFDKTGTRRQFSIEGDTGSGFMLQVVRTNDNKFYNFNTRTFASTAHLGANNVLKGVISGDKFSGSILFPSESSDKTYRVILMANPSTDTSVRGDVITKSINQFANTTITLAYVTANTTKYLASPPIANKTSVGSAIKKSATELDIVGTVTCANNATHAFGLRLTRQPVDSDFVFRTTTTLDGTTSSSTTLTVDSGTDLAVGTYLVSGPNLSGTPFITKITELDGGKALLSISSAQTLNSDGATLTFDARGSKGIYNATGVLAKFTAKAAAQKFTKTVRAAPSNSTTVALNNTRGIAGGGHVTISGINVQNTSANTIQSVAEDHDGSGSDGTITVQVAQQTSLVVGTVLSFKGSSISIDLTGALTLANYGKTDRTISLLLDNFITPGAAS